MSRRPGREASRGQSYVELALVLPVLVLIFLIALDFGRVFLGWVNLHQAARIGANFAALNPDANWGSGTDPARQRYEELIQADANAINCTLPSIPQPTFSDADGDGDSDDLGDRATVDLVCAFDILIARLPFMGVFITDPLPVRAIADWPIRAGTVAGIPVGPPPTPGPSPSPTAEPTSTPTGSPTATPTGSVPPAPAAGFYGTPIGPDVTGGGPSGDQILGPWPLRVDFTELSTGQIDTYAWTFGDGGTSSAQNPSYTYSNPGLYDVSLTVSNAGGSDAFTRVQYVHVGCQVPNFAGVMRDAAQSLWQSQGFTTQVQFVGGSGNWTIQAQSIPGGVVNPQPGGCAATITVYEQP